MSNLPDACLACPPSLVTIRPLVEGNPASVKVRDKEHGALPLHVACWNKAPLDVVQFLVKMYPNSIKVKDKNGRLVLHNACSTHGASLDVIHFLVEQYPDSVKVADKANGALPLHVAFKYEAPFEIIQYLVMMFPESIHIEDKYGVTPVKKAGKIKDIGHEVVAWLETLAATQQQKTSPTRSQELCVFQTLPKVSKPTLVTFAQDSNSNKINFKSLMISIQAEDSRIAAVCEAFRQLPSSKSAGFWLQPDHRDILRLILVEKCKTNEEEAERDAILANKKYCEFYLVLVRKLYSMISLCTSLSSSTMGVVKGRATMRACTLKLLEQEGLDGVKRTGVGRLVSDALSFAAKSSTSSFGVDSIGSFIKLIFELKFQRAQYLGVSHIADFATLANQHDSNGLQHEVERFARLLVQARCYSSRKQKDKNFVEKNVMLKLISESGNVPTKEQGSKAAESALAHILKPSQHIRLHDILTGLTVDINLYEALAAATLYMPVEELRRLPTFSSLNPTKVDYTQARLQILFSSPTNSDESSNTVSSTSEEDNDSIQRLNTNDAPYSIFHPLMEPRNTDATKSEREKRVEVSATGHPNANSAVNNDLGTQIWESHMSADFSKECKDQVASNAIEIQYLMDQVIVLNQHIATQRNRSDHIEREITEIVGHIYSKKRGQRGLWNRWKSKTASF